MNAFSSLRRRLARSCLLALVAGGLASRPALLAQSVVQSDFSSTSGLTLNSITGTPTTSDGTVLRLVGTTTTNDRASVFTTTTRNVSSFSTAFQFRFSNGGGTVDGSGNNGADGLVFTLQRVGNSALGGTGEELGYLGIGSQAVGIEFDSWKNSNRNDPNSSHVGLDLGNTVNSTVTAAISPDLDSNTVWTAWIDYDGTTLEIRVNNTGVRPGASLLSYDLTLSSQLGGNSAYVGFTAATGGAYANHDLLKWTFSDSYLAGGVTPGAAIPEPAISALAAGSALLLWALRKRRARA